MPENVVPVPSGLSPSAKPISAVLSLGAAPAALTAVLAGGEAGAFLVNANFNGDGNFASALGQALSTPGMHIGAASKGDAAASSASDPFSFIQPAEVPASAAGNAEPAQQNPLKEANNTAPAELALAKGILPKEIKKQAESEPALPTVMSVLPLLLSPSPPPPSLLLSPFASHASGVLPDPSSSNAAAVPPGASVAPPQAGTSGSGNGAGTNFVYASAIAADPTGALAVPPSPGEIAPSAPLPSGAEGPSSSSSSPSSYSAPASAPVADPEPTIPHTLGPTSETAPALPTSTAVLPRGAAGAANPADAANPQAGAQPPQDGVPTNPVSSSARKAPSADALARAPADEAAPASRSLSGTDGVASSSASPAKARAFGAFAQTVPASPGSSATQPAAARQAANSPPPPNQTQATPPSGASVPIFVATPNPPNSAATASAQTAAPTPAAPATPPTSASPPTPVAQIADALVSFAAGPNGAQGFTLALSPPELGYLSVHLTQTDHGAITVELAASEPATLRLLLQDQTALHQALTQAGLPEAGRSLSFHLAEAGPSQAAGQAGSFAASTSSGGQGQGHPQRSSAQASFSDFGAFSQGSRGHGGSANEAAAEGRGKPESLSRTTPANSLKPTSVRSAAPIGLRAWVDITA